jgi:two-component system, chemotaxis family, response regulator WspF
VRIGIVNDQPLAVQALRRALEARPQHQIAWVAEEGARAIALCARDLPDLVLMDLLMPGIDGVQATKVIMERTPCPILIVTSSVDERTAAVFDAMGFGAIDAVDTPNVPARDPSSGAASFLRKIDALARLIETRRFVPAQPSFEDTWVIGKRERLVAIGASAGGPMALGAILAALPKTFPAAIVIIQHVDERFAAEMAQWLSRGSALKVRVAEEGDRPAPGTVLLAGTNDHLIFKSKQRLGYTPEPVTAPYRPSVDVFFNSVSALWAGEAVGVLLTGMGRDGALGLKSMRDKGHQTIAQDQATSAVYGMPKAAADLGAALDILPIDEIGQRLVRTFSGRE